MVFKKIDVLIIGSGVAGLYAALHLDSRLNILMLSKNASTLCNSALAQGGVAAVMDKKSGDGFELHIKDSLVAGGYENNRENLRILVENGPENIENLLKLGVNFDKNDDGSVNLTLEGGHSRRRIAHHKDSTGFEIVSALLNRVKRLPNVTLLENARLLRLEKQDFFLAEVFKDGERRYYAAEVCVTVSGGIGRVYNFTTNSSVATGDGIYFAAKLGAEIKKMNYIQFHPTAFAPQPEPGRRVSAANECFLISEAVRGEGAYLYNCRKERFMSLYEPERMELAPRDVVSGCIMKEEQRTGSSDFFLDISHKDGEFIKSRFPMIYNRLLEKGYDLTAEPVPIYPCQHYLMGGIAVGGNGRTRVPKLYAAGECAYTGVHGANRLASNSLLEALVFPRLVAEDVNRLGIGGNTGEAEYNAFGDIGGEPAPEAVLAELRAEIRGIMQKAFFVAPNYEAAEKGLKRIEEINAELRRANCELNPDSAETLSVAGVAEMILKQVIINKE